MTDQGSAGETFPSGFLRARPRAYETEARWDLLIVCVAVVILTAVARLHLVFPALGLVRPVLVFCALGVAFYLLDVHPMRRPGMLRSPATTWLLGLAVWMALTVPGALVASRSFIFLVDNFLKTLVVYGLVVGAARGPQDVRRLAFTYFAGAALYAAAILLRFEVGQGSWRLDRLYTYDPNDFATFAVTAMPLGLYFLVHPAGRVQRAAALLGCGTLSVAFVWAGSRGGLLALLGVMVFLLLRYRAVPLRWRALGTGLVALIVLAVASERFWEQMATLLDPSRDYNITAPTGRLNVWRRGIGYMLDQPLFGVGANNFTVAEGVLSPLAELQQYGIGVRWTAPHNSLVQVGAELGIPGLLLFLGLLVSTLRVLRAVERSSVPCRAGEPDPVPIAQALMGSLIGFLIGGFFLSLAYSSMLYLLVALAAALRKVAGPAVPARMARRPRVWVPPEPAARSAAQAMGPTSRTFEPERP